MGAVDAAPLQGLSAASPASGSKRLDGLAIVLACFACAAGLAARGRLPEWSLPWCAGIALAASCALPLLARWKEFGTVSLYIGPHATAQRYPGAK